MSQTIAGKPSEEVIDYLLKRRSVKADTLAEPGPNKAQIETMLRAAARVPDHGMLCPWYFIVLSGDARVRAGAVLRDAYARENPDCRDDKLDAEEQRLMRAPCVIVVVSRLRQGKPPKWEQILSAGAACQNLVLAANAHGFGAQWLTEWYGYDKDVKAALGLEQGRDHIAGFVYIGTPSTPAEERARPDLENIVTYLNADLTPPQKGDIYNRTKFDLPEDGFDFKPRA